MSYGVTYVTASRQHNRWEYLQNIYVTISQIEMGIKRKKNGQQDENKNEERREK